MATTNEYIEYVCEQIKGIGEIRYVPFVKELDCIKDMMQTAETGYPYNGAKEHYVLDIDNNEFCKSVIIELEKVTPIPKSKKKLENK